VPAGVDFAESILNVDDPDPVMEAGSKAALVFDGTPVTLSVTGIADPLRSVLEIA